MLHVRKNQLVAGLAKKQVDIRQLELEWYCNNYSTITGQATLLAGFAFAQLTTPLPEDVAIPFSLELGYLSLTSTAVGLELSAIVLSNFLSTWAPSLALRGKRGCADLHRSVDVLRQYQAVALVFFLLGWVVFFISNLFQVWIYFRRGVAAAVSIPFACFTLAALWLTAGISRELRLDESEAVAGKIEHFRAYEFIGDLDAGLSDLKATSVGDGTLRNCSDDQQPYGFCPIHEDLEEFAPRKAVELFTPTLASERNARQVQLTAPLGDTARLLQRGTPGQAR